mmetsp:Transcript_7876/g.11421  ORF Transcript_7876/g.11421 Transcript_7876/m.11421 type:complete len:171 (+) Transcript_7876:101-613(+)
MVNTKLLILVLLVRELQAAKLRAKSFLSSPADNNAAKEGSATDISKRQLKSNKSNNGNGDDYDDDKHDAFRWGNHNYAGKSNFDDNFNNNNYYNVVGAQNLGNSNFNALANGDNFDDDTVFGGRVNTNHYNRNYRNYNNYNRCCNDDNRHNNRRNDRNKKRKKKKKKSRS